MVRDLPAALAVDVLAIPGNHFVADNGQMAFGLVTEELLEQSTDDWAHARGQDHDGDIVLLGPVVELFKVGVQFHVLFEDLDALVIGSVDTLQHDAEGVPN